MKMQLQTIYDVCLYIFILAGNCSLFLCQKQLWFKHEIQGWMSVANSRISTVSLSIILFLRWLQVRSSSLSMWRRCWTESLSPSTDSCWWRPFWCSPCWLTWTFPASAPSSTWRKSSTRPTTCSSRIRWVSAHKGKGFACTVSLNRRLPSSAIPEGPGSRGAHPGEGSIHRCVQAAVWQRPQWPLWEHDLPH